MSLFKFLLVSLLTLLTINLTAQATELKHHSVAGLNCLECHSCEKPSYKNPCLKIFPDFKREGLTLQSSAEEVPELIKIDTLSRLYEPSTFTHMLHAEMSDMSGGCSICHHHNPPGKVLACIECHEASKKRDDVNKPGLSGAYHQQCLNCHRNWSHNTKCTICHAKKGEKLHPDNMKPKSSAHAKIESPVKLIYNTEEEDNPVVTFYHDAHNKVYGLSCSTCHIDETCSRCHDSSAKTKDSEYEAHDNCISCHEYEIDDKCSKCHDVKEKSPFTHARIGWPLADYHKQLNCRDCHEGNRFTKLNRRCTSCHSNFETGSFDHSVTGLILDENHFENDCEDCHTDHLYTRRPNCTECHDDYAYPKEKPGKLK